jgi:4-hydroxybenzoate polyprenyltransferase
MAGTLNAASNIWNQICDIEIDRINKPHRLLVTGAVSMRTAGIVCAFLYVLSLALAATIESGSGRECLAIVAFTSFVTYAYSGRPFRWRRFGWRANIAIALPRGLLLKVAGWSTVAPVFTSVEPWCLGLVFMLFLLGATTTKDLDDIEGDAADGVQNLTVRLGKLSAIRTMAPFFVLPWLMLPLMGWINVLTPSIASLAMLGAILATYGAYVVSLLFRAHSPDDSRFENHIAWRHMYGLMMVAQVGSCAIYHI